MYTTLQRWQSETSKAPNFEGESVLCTAEEAFRYMKSLTNPKSNGLLQMGAIEFVIDFRDTYHDLDECKPRERHNDLVRDWLMVNICAAALRQHRAKARITVCVRTSLPIGIPCRNDKMGICSLGVLITSRGTSSKLYCKESE